MTRKEIIDMMERGEYELKPCPFCGKQPELESKDFFEELDSKVGDACILISCPNCSLDFYDHTYGEHDYYIRANIIVEKWNRRASSK